ncbi:MAG: primary-amine oxidase [Hyphomicrobiaceae bacterium]
MPDVKSLPYPLDPLSAEEIAAAVTIVRRDGGLDGTAWVETVAVAEPEKAVLEDKSRRWRKAEICFYERSSGKTFEGIVDLAEGTLESWSYVPGAHARIVIDEFNDGMTIAAADPEVQAALRKRGITNFDRVVIEPWAAGNFDIPGEEGQRIAYGHCWLADEEGDNPYAHPIANLHPVIDLRARKVLRVDDFGIVPVPPAPAKISRRTTFRTDLKPLHITQPEGPSFTVDGHEVRWQKWRFRVGFNVREGLVLHQIGYEDGGRLRSIMHRASMSEMVVPYGDPTGGNFRRNAFDTGEYGIGQLLDSLTLGCDCLGHIHYFDMATHDWSGASKVVKNAICMHEEDYGLLWKYTNWLNGEVTSARSRRLVVSSIATIGNYVYGFFWYFYQDGSIGIELKATGIPFPTGIAPGDRSPYGETVAPGITSHVHQHCFSFRFDMAIDGERNAVREVDCEMAPAGSGNPYGNAGKVIVRPLESELQAQRPMDLARSRYWKVINPSVNNALGTPVGYKLVPGVNSFPFLRPESPVGKRAAFMFNHFWATKYHPNELFAAGKYPNQHAGGDGLPKWTKRDAKLEGERIVAWYTLNYHHLPRPEDFPVQPVVYANFHWMPSGFFDKNPALDVPMSKDQKSCCT